MFDWSRRLCAEHFDVERSGYAACHLILKRKQIIGRAIETLGPRMRIGLGVDQLGVYPCAAARSTDAAFQYVTHIQFAADLLSVDRLVAIAERCVARDHEHVRDPR